MGSDPGTRDAITSPGELTLQHHSSRQRCSDCHINADFNLITDAGNDQTDSLHGQLESHAIQDSQKCIKCHNLGESPLNPHAMSQNELTSLTKQSRADRHVNSAPWLVTVANNSGRSPMHADKLACSLCHKEHRGRFSDLQQFSDGQCQVCHTKQFHSFVSGHPEYEDFPYSQRTRIHFDHSTHYGTHFANFKRVMPDGIAPATCRSCHVSNSTRQMMTLVSYETACGSCHTRQMQGPYTDIAFFALPELDIREQPVGEWPEPPSGHSMTGLEDLPPFMTVLLSTQSQWQEGMHILERAEDDAAAQRGYQKLAIATKLLTGDLIENGESALRRRLRAAVGDYGSEQVVDRLTLSTSPLINILRNSAGVWFPNLSDEWNSLDGNSPPDRQTTSIDQQLTSVMDANWHVGTNPSVIRYRPSRHAEATPKEMLDALVQISGIQEEPDTRTSIGALRGLYRQMTHPRGAFRCIKCHSIDQTPDETLIVNWQALKPDTKQRRLVRFSHAPHITLLNHKKATIHDQDCRTCHILEELEQRNQKFFHRQYETLTHPASANVDRTERTCSGFGPITKSVCVECHTQQLAGNSCLKCHNYHASDPPH